MEKKLFKIIYQILEVTIMSKLILPGLVTVAIFIVYTFYFAPSKELGLFSKFNAGSEINQRINVMIMKNKKIGKDAKGDILSFFAKDRINKEVFVSLHEPESSDILDAEIVELLGHMHGSDFVASRVSIIE
jgi:hypothetical protein